MPSEELQKLLASVYDQLQRLDDRAANAQARQDFVFHMTDWLPNLDALKSMSDHPERWDRDTAALEIVGFLYHVIPHLNAAGRLLLGKVSDPFAEDGKS